MTVTVEERKRRIMSHLQTHGGEGEFNDVPVKPRLGEREQDWWEAWAELYAEGRIEYAPGSPQNIYLARFRLKAQMRLL